MPMRLWEKREPVSSIGTIRTTVSGEFVSPKEEGKDAGTMPKEICLR